MLRLPKAQVFDTSAGSVPSFMAFSKTATISGQISERSSSSISGLMRAEYHKCSMHSAAGRGSRYTETSSKSRFLATIWGSWSFKTTVNSGLYPSGKPFTVATTLRKSPEAANKG